MQLAISHYNSNCGRISYCFRDIYAFSSKIACIHHPILPSISEVTRRRRSALFGHVARLQDFLPHKALRCHVDLSLGRPPNDQWKRSPGRPRERWIDQVRKDNGIPPADLWRRSTSRGHREATLRPSLATR